MEASHLTAWLGDAETIPILDDASVSVAREHVRKLAGEVALAQVATETIAIAATELVRNQLVHARGGRFVVRRIERRSVRGLELIAADRGPGLVDPTATLEEILLQG